MHIFYEYIWKSVYDNNTKFIQSHNVISNVNTHRHNQPLGVGNDCVQNESLSKEWTIT